VQRWLAIGTSTVKPLQPVRGREWAYRDGKVGVEFVPLAGKEVIMSEKKSAEKTDC
jgi:hypothetical protein